MRKFFYIVIVAALFFAPVKRVEIGKLLPVRALAVYVSDGETVLETDTGDRGRGVDAHTALENLKEVTSSIVYLETTEYLLVSEDATDHVEQLRSLLKPGVKVCVCEARDRVDAVAKYLDVHGELTELHSWRTK